MNITFRPIHEWPTTLAASRRSSPFKATYNDTLVLLDRELKNLKAKNIVIQLALSERDIRNDGLPRADARAKHPGVILAFESKHGPLSYPCDTFTHWEANLRAIAISLEYLRAVDRYGVTKRGEQYRGWQTLADPESEFSEAQELLQSMADMPIRDAEGLRVAFRKACFKAHPDHGGNPELFAKITRAKLILEASFST